MIRADLLKFSSVGLRQLKEIKQKLVTIAENNDDIVKLANSGDWLQFQSSDERFKFAINELWENAGNISATVLYNPESEISINRKVFKMLLTDAVGYFKSWVKTVKEYEFALNDYLDPYTQKAAQDIFDEIDILDEDADTNPFDTNRQEFFYKYLSFAEDELSKEPQNDAEIIVLIEDVKLLKNNVQSKTKRQFIKGLSNFLAKTKKKSMPLFLSLLDITKKEALKKILNAGFDELPSAFHKIQHFLNL